MNIHIGSKISIFYHSKVWIGKKSIERMVCDDHRLELVVDKFGTILKGITTKHPEKIDSSFIRSPITVFGKEGSQKTMIERTVELLNDRKVTLNLQEHFKANHFEMFNIAALYLDFLSYEDDFGLLDGLIKAPIHLRCMNMYGLYWNDTAKIQKSGLFPYIESLEVNYFDGSGFPEMKNLRSITCKYFVDGGGNLDESVQNFYEQGIRFLSSNGRVTLQKSYPDFLILSEGIPISGKQTLSLTSICTQKFSKFEST